MVMIRGSRPEDTSQLEDLFQLIRQISFTSRSKDEFQIGDYARSVEEDEVWVAEEGDEIIGFVSTYPADNLVHNLFVHPDQQGCGIGSTLLETAEANLSRPMTLKIAMENFEVSSFYLSRAWFRVSVHEDAKEPYILYKKD